MLEKIKITDNMNSVMFEVLLPERYIHILTLRNQIKKYIKTVKKVEPGTGNSGKNLEFDTVYDGYYVPWNIFKSVTDEDDSI